MLSTPAPFPQVGAVAFLKPNAERVRIVRRNAGDGTALIAFADAAYMGKATGNTTVPLAELAETREAAFATDKPQRRARRTAR